MNDVARDFIWSQKVHGCYGADIALEALDAERAEHLQERNADGTTINILEDARCRYAKQVADLHEQLRLSTIDAANEMAENSDLRQRISELEGQLQDDDPPTRLSGTMEPERCECNEPPYCLKLRDECLSHAGWSFCPNCGKPLAGKDRLEELEEYGPEVGKDT